MRHRIAHLLVLISLLAFPSGASAGSYWWSGTPTAGANGFSWEQSGGYSPWGGSNRCESAPATIPTGGYCNLRWTVPSGLDAQAGSIAGSYRHNNSHFEQRNHVDGAGVSTLQGDSTVRGYTRQWADMGTWLAVQLINTGPPQTVSGGTQWFDAGSFSVSLHDGHAPGLNILDGHGGWRGTGGACVRYGFGETGSGLDAVALVNTSTGQTIDNPSYASAAVTTGVFQTDRTPCFGAPGTGHYGFEARAVDKSGNQVAHAFTVAFDVTPPSIGAPHAAGAEVGNGRRLLGTAGQHRPTFTFAASDGHSGLVGQAIYLDGAHVANGGSWTPGADLAVGTHTITVVAADAVGNQSTVVRSFVVVDDVAPSITVTAPTSAGGNEPVLDVAASDDRSAIDAASWSVVVDGEPLVVRSTTARLQASLGRLVDASHTIVVRVRDAAGNQAVRTIAYTADSGDDVPNLTAGSCPALTCVAVHRGPTASTQVEQGETVRIGATFAKSGRPVGGTVSVLRQGTSVASGEVGSTGVAELDVRVDGPGPLVLVAPAGSGLPNRELEYDFISDIVPPVIAVASPAATGGSSPVLDVSATDARTGIDASSWTVTVDGAPFVASSATARLQAELGALVDGTHTIVVRVKDGAGNEGVATIAYAAESGDDVPNPTLDDCGPEVTCVYVWKKPNPTDEIQHGTTIRIGALFIRRGRPVVGTVELRTGTATLVSKETGASGVVDMGVVIERPGPLVLVAPAGSGIGDVSIPYVYKALRSDPPCVPGTPGCHLAKDENPSVDGDEHVAEVHGPDHQPVTPPNASGGGASAATGTPGAADGQALHPDCTATSSVTCPRGVVYYVRVNGELVPFWNGVPLGESGSKYDKAAPQWKLSAVQRRRGLVRSSRRIQLRLWTNEASFVRVQPAGGIRTVLVSPRRKLRVVTLAVPARSALGRRIARGRAGTVLPVRLVVGATDLNGNVTKQRALTFRIRL